ncbi:MAG: substrate-binding domain-containing protein [Lacticaseibacillus paracasei]
MNDSIRIIRAAQQNGIRIPQDLAVMGFDDIAESRVVTPKLTTIHVPVHTIATLAINRLTELSEGHYIQYTVKSLVEPTFINRQTL